MIEQREPKWADVVKHIEREIEALRANLEHHQPEVMTYQIRGEIRALRRLLEFGKPMTPPDPKKMIQPETPGFA